MNFKMISTVETDEINYICIFFHSAGVDTHHKSRKHKTKKKNRITKVDNFDCKFSSKKEYAFSKFLVSMLRMFIGCFLNFNDTIGSDAFLAKRFLSLDVGTLKFLNFQILMREKFHKPLIFSSLFFIQRKLYTMKDSDYFIYCYILQKLNHTSVVCMLKSKILTCVLYIHHT